MSLGAHVVEGTRARVWAEACQGLAGLSWGNPKTREAYARALAPHDTLAAALAMASEQSSCALVACAALFEAGIDGRVRAWRGQAECDPLRVPRQGHYDAIMFLEQLARQRGGYQAPTRERPDIALGSWVLIGGKEGDNGGEAHIVCVVDRDGDVLVCVEGGKLDPGNPRPGPKNCTLVATTRRELYQAADGSWWMRDEGSQGRGRRVRYHCWVGCLPLA